MRRHTSQIRAQKVLTNRTRRFVLSPVQLGRWRVGFRRHARRLAAEEPSSPFDFGPRVLVLVESKLSTAGRATHTWPSL